MVLALTQGGGKYMKSIMASVIFCLLLVGAVVASQPTVFTARGSTQETVVIMPGQDVPVQGVATDVLEVIDEPIRGDRASITFTLGEKKTQRIYGQNTVLEIMVISLKDGRIWFAEDSAEDLVMPPEFPAEATIRLRIHRQDGVEVRPDDMSYARTVTLRQGQSYKYGEFKVTFQKLDWIYPLYEKTGREIGQAEPVDSESARIWPTHGQKIGWFRVDFENRVPPPEDDHEEIKRLLKENNRILRMIYDLLKRLL